MEPLDDIEKTIHGEDHPGDDWFVDTIEMLIKYVRAVETFNEISPIVWNQSCKAPYTVMDRSAARIQWESARDKLGLK